MAGSCLVCWTTEISSALKVISSLQKPVSFQFTYSSCSFWRRRCCRFPDKMHGINDPEIRQRQRYADLIAGSLQLERDEGDLTPRETFERRLKNH